MASRDFDLQLFFLLVSSFTIVQTAMAGDVGILTDFFPNKCQDSPRELLHIHRHEGTGWRPSAFKVMKASMVELMALNGQSVSYAVLQYPVVTVNPTHTHPLSAELLFLIDGTPQVGSANARTVSIPSNLFTTGIDENVLVKSFKTDVATIHKLKAGLVPKP